MPELWPVVNQHPGAWSLALIGNASGTVLGRSGISIQGVFDKTSCASGAPPSMKIGFSGLAHGISARRTQWSIDAEDSRICAARRSRSAQG